ncbi:MAG: hypothetical protein NC548_45485 [Lachnospiraceae bacterium]|nr:hypothetical protein [Lachnospiraceae bacterium]
MQILVRFRMFSFQGGDITECPECGNKTKVLDSRKFAGAVYRKRKCKDCNFTFYTEELEIDSSTKVLKDMWSVYRMRSRDNAKKKNKTS